MSDSDFLLDYGIDVKNRRIFLHNDIELHKPGESVQEHVVRGLFHLDSLNKKKIELWINTAGGCVYDMFGMYDVIRQLESEIWTIGFGSAYSAGGIILAAGDRRFATKNCWFMFHQMAVYYEESLSNIKVSTKAHDRMDNQICKIMAERTKKPEKFWKDCPTEIWWDSNDMLKYGLIEAVWPPEESNE